MVMTTEELADYWRDKYRNVRDQRDELLEACKELLKEIDNFGDPERVIHKIAQAIANARKACPEQSRREGK